VASGGVAQMAAWIAGLCFYLPAISWMRVADPTMIVAWILLSIYCAAHMVFSVWLLRRIDRKFNLPFALTVPLVWTADEFLRGRLGGGFSWYFLGHAQHAALPMIQIADVGGELFVTFVVAAVNGWFADLLTRPSRSLCWSATVVGCLLIASVGYGYRRLSQSQFTPGPKVSLIQGNIEQNVRNDLFFKTGKEYAEYVEKHFFDLCQQAAKEKPDLIIWPETSLPGEIYFDAPGIAHDSVPFNHRAMIDESAENMKRLGKYWGITQLLGANCAEFGPGDKERRFNSAVLVDRERGYSARYNKIHCVPFGEYVPLVDYMPWLQKFTPYEGNYSLTPGNQLIHLPVTSADSGPFYFGTLICYEDAVTQLARGYVAANTPHVDFLVNISNDGWFKGTSEHEQHLAICQFRAVECRRAVVRAVNMGISAVIDSNGRVTHLPGPTWSASKAIAAVVTATVPIDHRFSRYAMFGDWLPWTCIAIVFSMVLWPRWSR